MDQNSVNNNVLQFNSNLHREGGQIPARDGTLRKSLASLIKDTGAQYLLTNQPPALVLGWYEGGSTVLILHK